MRRFWDVDLSGTPLFIGFHGHPRTVAALGMVSIILYIIKPRHLLEAADLVIGSDRPPGPSARPFCFEARQHASERIVDSCWIGKTVSIASRTRPASECSEILKGVRSRFGSVRTLAASHHQGNQAVETSLVRRMLWGICDARDRREIKWLPVCLGYVKIR
jgi:hypothetical protein